MKLDKSMLRCECKINHDYCDHHWVAIPTTANKFEMMLMCLECGCEQWFEDEEKWIDTTKN